MLGVRESLFQILGVFISGSDMLIGLIDVGMVRDLWSSLAEGYCLGVLVLGYFWPLRHQEVWCE